MAKEFDIYLNKRLTQCDIIVYSIPYRDGLTVVNRLILEACLESYTLQKFVAAQSGSELVSHIDKMIKTCLERLKNGVSLDVNTDFKIHYALKPSEHVLELSAEKLKTIANVYESATNALQIVAAPISACIKKSLGHGISAIETASTVESLFKRSLEKATTQLEMCADSLEIQKYTTEKISSSIPVNSELVDLLYRICDTSSMAIDISAQAVEAELSFSLGKNTLPIVLDNRVLGEQIKIFEAMRNVVSLLSLATESLIQFINPNTNVLSIASEVDAIIKHYRLLYEMDSDALSSFDDMSLEYVDYVIL